MASETSSGDHIFPPWQLERWKAVDDRVRGGSSISHLDQAAEGSSSAVRFWGHLDIETLGGAGFASQRFVFAPEPLLLPRHQYNGIILHLPAVSTDIQSNVHTFTLVLKTSLSDRTQPPNVPPSPEPATLSYEANFHRTSGESSSAAKSETIRLNLEEFDPTYRGRKVERSDPRYQPLHSEKIYEISLMCRSGFGKQAGDFELVIDDITKWEKQSKLGQLFGLLAGLWRSFTAFWVRCTGKTGRIRLDDEEKDRLLE